MGENRNYAALDWVVGEIGETLTQARQALESYVEDTQDSTRIRFCLTHIHQVHGSLQMVEFYGAALLAEEMEKLAQALLEKKVKNEEEAHEVLMRAILQLPIYLDQVKQTRKDHPAQVLLLLNDLRAVRGEALLTETGLFSPDLSAARGVTGTRMDLTRNAKQFAAVVQKLRKMFQYAAAGVIRGVNSEENCNYLTKVFTRLEKLTQGTARHALWDICIALAEGLTDGVIEINVSVKNLLRQLDKEIKPLCNGKLELLEQFTSEELIKNILYYIARANEIKAGSQVDRIVKKYGLSEALPSVDESSESNQLIAPDQGAVRSVVSALKDELESIKHALDASLIGDDKEGSISPAIPVLKRIADTMAVLGIGELRKQIQAQANMLETGISAGNVTHDLLMVVAGNILEVETALESMAGGATGETLPGSNIHIDQAQDSVLRESRNGLEQAKDAIVEYISSQWDRDHLVNVPRLLGDIRGGLDMIPLTRPARILDSCGKYIEEELLKTESVPDWKTLDTLADAIASVEYYLERLGGDSEEEQDLLLTVAEESVHALGYGVPGRPRTKTTPAPIPPVETLSEVEEEPISEELTSAELVSEEPVLEESIVDEVPQPFLSSDEEEELTVELSAEPLVADVDHEQASPTVVAEVVEVESADDDEDLIDDEIVEIFIEEAGEVRETIEEFFPRWVENFEDTEALTEFRRAFHTLKGSGRMVEATDIGELAWSIENMLNRVIDGNVTAKEHHINLIRRVLSLLPDMIEAFKSQQPNPHKALTDQYQGWGDQLSQGEFPQELAGDVGGELELQQGTGEQLPVDEQPVEQAIEKAAEVEIEEDEDEAVLWEIFGSEAKTHLQVVTAFIDKMDQAAPLYDPPSDEMQRALHTLKGSAHMADITPIAQLATPLERFVKELRNYQVNIDDDILQLLKDGVSYTQGALQQIAERKVVEIPKLGQFTARVAELKELAVGHLIRQKECQEASKKQVAPELLAIFMAEEMKLLLEADQLLQQWRETPSDISLIHPLRLELNTLAIGAVQANLPPMANLSQQLIDIYDGYETSGVVPDAEAFESLLSVHTCLLDQVDAVAAGQDVEVPSEEIQTQLSQLLASTQIEEPEGPDTLDELGVLSELGEVTEIESEIVIEEGAELEPEVEAKILAELENKVEPQELVEEAETTEVVVEELSLGALPVQEIEVEDLGVQDSEVQSINLEDTVDELEVVPELELAPGLEIASEVEVEPAQGSEEAVIEEDDFPTEGDFNFAVDALTSIEEPEVLGPTALEEISFGGDAEELLQGLELEPSSDEQLPQDLEEVEIPTLGVSEQELPEAEGLQAEIPQPSEFENTSDSQELVHTLEEEVFGEQEPVPSDEADKLSPLSSPTINEYLDDYGNDADIDEEEVDPEVLEIFQEESEELLEQIENSIHALESSPEDNSHIEELKRALHTLKGGARLAGIKTLGDLAHDFETFLIAGERKQVDGDFIQTVHQYQDALLKGSADFTAGEISGKDSDVAPVVAEEASSLEESEASSTSETVETVDDEQVPSPALEASPSPGASPSKEAEPLSEAGKVLPFPPKVKEEVPSIPFPQGPASSPQFTAPKVTGGGAVAAAARSQPQEVVKVNAELLEELVNLAGETSISRGRMEEQVSEWGFALEEMETTILRLQEQLRRLDIETEAQVLFRQEQMEQQDDFDPLEMDRYSTLQQLSRSLTESASDLYDLKRTLTDKTRDTETLLLQQSRINTDLQEGLMRSRMVPFSRLVPRLRRIVRQAATELSKQVNFEMENVEGELDRTVLERMIAPLEHMLRNAVDHGIETGEQRLKSNKSEAGSIVLSLGREGGDVLLRLADDGAGIDLDRVRTKAIEHGLMSHNAKLSDHDIMQFILHAGFSTADKVTQISGRGVGMDVVHSEIKQLGGSMFINSQRGAGTEFVVRLPFTVSVNRALMVQIGDDHYALPLNTIEGIVRISPFELEHYYQNPDSGFEYAGEKYQVKYLGRLLNTGARPKLEGTALPMPVVLVRTNENAVALQVDSLLGSREIVVKSLGPQFGAVQGLSGATVMGDGSVVVILDLHALIRRDAVLSSQSSVVDLIAAEEAAAAQQDTQTVMVIDDSVTVRKVTSRLLEREGYDVITAKDGTDALQVLQDHIPDIMLLDIEMPRMDGFEVAKNVRSSSRLKHIPIIMITSRTGDKHRERAFSLGVNQYMGKPYQEDVLLENIQQLIGESDER